MNNLKSQPLTIRQAFYARIYSSPAFGSANKYVLKTYTFLDTIIFL